jgi:hypothetical protein
MGDEAMSEVSRGEFQMLMQMLRDGFDGTHRRLDILNGRIGKNEQNVATVMERTNGLERNERNNGGRGTAAMTGGGASLGVVGLTKLIEWLTK